MCVECVANVPSTPPLSVRRFVSVNRITCFGFRVVHNGETSTEIADHNKNGSHKGDCVSLRSALPTTADLFSAFFHSAIICMAEWHTLCPRYEFVVNVVLLRNTQYDL